MIGSDTWGLLAKATAVDTVIKIVMYAAIGVLLLGANIWFFRTIYQSLTGGDLVVAPFKITGGPTDSSALGESLARMLIARIRAIEWDLEQSQTSLRRADRSKESPTGELKAAQAGDFPSGVTSGIFGASRTAGLHARLFEPTNIDIKIGGVDVGGLLPRIQRMFAEDRTISFSVAMLGKSAIVAGSIDALGTGMARPIWIKLDDATAESIADSAAFALIQAQWAKSGPEYSELPADEFKKLVLSVSAVAEVNRRVAAFNIASKSEFERILVDVAPLAEKMQRWNELTYFAATIAEGAQSHERALNFYRRLRKADTPRFPVAWLNQKINELEKLAKLSGPSTVVALEKMKEAARFAAGILNNAFNMTLGAPEISLISSDIKNAYWDGAKINAPPIVQDLPDIIYHEAAWPFVQKAWPTFVYHDQSGALAQSYTDVLTSLIKQKEIESDGA